MSEPSRPLWSVVVAVVAAIGAALAISACGSTTSSSTQPTSGGEGGTATVVEGVFPQSLDPSIDFTTQGGEVHWLTHLGAYTYAHAAGAAGTKVIPAIATALPTVSEDGKTYEFTIRKGLTYSDGSPVRASDLAFGIKRALKLGWSAASFLTNTIAGASEYAEGKAKTVSGVTTDDATGKITIHLIKQYGAFEDVLAVPGVVFMPQSTPMKPQPNDPPAGFGPYEIKNVVPNVSFDLVRNPDYPSQAIPGIPAGHLNVHVKVQSNTTTEASEVLNNSADVFDWGDTVPPALIQQVSGLSDRFKAVQTNQTFFWFLNVTEKPFNNQMAREAVAMAVDRPALAQLASGTLAPGCYLLPPNMVGHPSQACPYGDPNAAPDVAAAKELVQKSGMAGEPVTVWAQNRQPRLEWAENYAATLNAIGFKATLKTIADADYFATIDTLKNHPQTGFSDWLQDFPNPTDFYQVLVDGRAIAPVGNPNNEEINDPFVQKQLDQLYPVQASDLQSAAAKWEALDSYVSKKAYVVPFGYASSPEFVSDRINFDALVFSPLQGGDFSSLELK
jgi:peptide/nickel transport system substrate-binding protein